MARELRGHERPGEARVGCLGAWIGFGSLGSLGLVAAWSRKRSQTRLSKQAAPSVRVGLSVPARNIQSAVRSGLPVSASCRSWAEETTLPPKEGDFALQRCNAVDATP